MVRFRKLAGLSVVYGLGDMLGKGLYLLLLPIYSIYLAPEEYALVALAMAVYGLLTFLHNAAATAPVTRFYFDFEEDAQRREFFGVVFLILLLQALLVSGALDWWGSSGRPFLKQVPFSPYVRLAIWAAFLAAVPRAIPLPLYRARMNALGYTLCNLSLAVGRVAAISYFVIVLGTGARGSMWGELVGAALVVVPYSIVTLRNITFRWRSDYLGRLLVFALPLVPHQLAHWTLMFADRFILERSVDLAEVGIYAFAYSVSMVLVIAFGALNNTWQPFLFGGAVEESQHSRIRTSLTYFVGAVLSIGLFFLLLAAPTVEFLMAESYHAAVEPMPLIALGMIFLGLSYLPMGMLFLKKKTGMVAASTGTAAIANITLNVVLVPRFGIMGAAFATAASYGLMLLIAVAVAWRHSVVPYDWARMVKMVLLVGITWFVCSWIDLSNALLEIGTRGAAAVAVLVLGAWAVGLPTPEEKAKVRALVTTGS